MFTPNQISLQTFLANGLVPKTTISFATSIATARNPSSKQQFYIDKLVNDILNPKPQTGTPSNFDPSPIFKLFDNAQKKLRHPKINLKTDGGLPLRMNTSRNHPNCVFLGSGGFGSPTYGKLMRSGEIHWYSKDHAERTDVQAMVEKFAKDPVKVSADYGKLNHNCCYCSKALDTVESLDVGYGPVCAKHFDLPWGGKTTKRTKPNVKELLEVIEATTGIDVSTAIDSFAQAAIDSEMNEMLIDA
jgi:hypothetical protein